MPPLALTESTQACSPARCSGSADGPEKLPMVPMTRSDPDAATAEPELELDALVLVLRAATAAGAAAGRGEGRDRDA